MAAAEKIEGICWRCRRALDDHGGWYVYEKQEPQLVCRK